MSQPLALPWQARPVRRLPLWAAVPTRLLFALGALFVFIFALETLKQGAGGVADILESASAHGSVNILGFGWLGSYFVMSGSPVAAIAVSLRASNVISDNEAFAMLNGSRLGASFIVLFIGFLYYLGRKRTANGLFIGAVALLTTFTIYIPVWLIGSFLLQRGWFDGIEFPIPTFVGDFKEFTFRPAVDWLAGALPRLLLFTVGVGLLFASFQIFDRALPNLEQPSLRVERISRLLRRPLAMFALGLVITMITLSVSISVTLLIPLSLKRYIRRGDVIPYVMGASISTWLDTMLAAILLDSPRAFTIVFTQMAVGLAVSLAVLLFAYRPYSRVILALARRASRSRAGFALFLGAILLVPLVLFFW